MAATPTTAPETAAAGLDLAGLEKAIANAPLAWRERLARHFTPAALRAARLEERSWLLARMAVGRQGGPRALAEAIHAEVNHYAASAWRYERKRSAPSDARHALAHRVLTLGGDKPLAGLSVRSLERLFAGRAKKTAGNGAALRR